MEISVNKRFAYSVRTVILVITFTIIFAILTALVSVLLLPYSLVWYVGIFFCLFGVYISFYSSTDEYEQKEHEKQMHASRELYATLYNQSPVPYLTLDEEGRVTTCNQAALRLLETNTETIIGGDHY